MSEIKGQLLGVILVLLVFAAVSGAMIAIVKNMTAGVSEKVDDVVDSLSTSGSGHYHISELGSY